MDYTKLKPPSCETCPLWQAPGPVWGEGSPRDAQVIYIAQNPGATEVEPLSRGLPGRPLIGPSGNVFNRQLFEAGVKRNDLYITNVVKCLTPGNREPEPAEISACRHFLDGELATCRADTVVLAGAVSFSALLGRYSSLGAEYHPSNKRGQDLGVMARMGCVEQRNGRKWIGTIHSANIMRQPENRLKAIDHLKKAWSIAGVKIPLPQVEIFPPDDFIPHMIDEIRAGGEFADDVETAEMKGVEEDDYVGSEYQVTMLGIGYAPYRAAIFKPDQIHLLQPIFANPRLWRYEHNGSYDQYHIEKFIGAEYCRASCFDTMHGHHFLRSFDDKFLKPNVLSTYTNLPYYGRDLERVSVPLYCGMDNIATFHAAREERRQLQAWGILDLYMEYGQAILEPLEEWRRIGINVDTRKALFYKRVIELKIERGEQLIAELCGSDFNPHSHVQMKKFLYETHGLPKQFNKQGKEPPKLTADYEAKQRLKTWIERKGEPAGKHRVAYEFLALSDYVNGEQTKLQFIDRVSPDGRIHAFMKAHGTSSFRLSSAPNIQNIPIYDISDWGGAKATQDKSVLVDPIGLERKSYGSLRSMVIPDTEEDWLVSCDYAQLQVWIMAALFKVKWLLDIHASGNYLYGDVYERLFGEKFFEDKGPRTKENKRKDVSGSKLRSAKAVPLGFLFGRSGEAVAIEHGWEIAEGNELRKWWFDHVPELSKAYPLIEYKMQQQGWLRHAFGQIVWYPTLKGAEAVNSHAQSNEAFIMRGTILQITRGLRERFGPYHPVRNRNRIVLSVHDSLTFNLQERDLVEAVETIIIPAFRRPIPQLDGFAFDCSCEVGKMWDWKTTTYAEWKREHNVCTDSRQRQQLGEAPQPSSPGDPSSERWKEALAREPDLCEGSGVDGALAR